MKLVTKKYQVYKFAELSDKAKEKAISDHIEFWLETMDYEQGSDGFKQAINESERMQTPWFVGSYVYDYCKDEIVDEILLNDYDFLRDGSIFTIG